jgi:hypothetical protein
MSTLDTTTEQAVDCDGLETVDWDDIRHRLWDPWPSPHTPLECRWVRDEASDGRLISVWYSRPR